jgi:hypothetical protein
MASTDRAWTKGTRVRLADKRTARVDRDAKPGATVHVVYERGSRGGWVAARLLTEIDDQGREV